MVSSTSISFFYTAAIMSLATSANALPPSRVVRSAQPAKPAYTPHCGTTQSKVTQHTFEGTGGSPLFGSFCKSWNKDKDQSTTIYSDGGHITFDYKANSGGKECTMQCSDAYFSMAIGCAQGDGNGNMYTTGSGDFTCGVFSFEIKPEPPATKFYFGSLSGDTQNGNSGYGPSQQPVCQYVMYKDGENICKAGNVTPADKTGGCPGEKETAPNFCGQKVGMGYPSGYTLKTGDDCGNAENEQYKKDASKQVPDGTHYADVIDTNNGNQKVGECVYQLAKEGYCTDVVTTLIPEHFITCTVH